MNYLNTVLVQLIFCFTIPFALGGIQGRWLSSKAALWALSIYVSLVYLLYWRLGNPFSLSIFMTVSLSVISYGLGRLINMASGKISKALNVAGAPFLIVSLGAVETGFLFHHSSGLRLMVMREKYFENAKNLYAKGEYKSCLSELAKLHQTTPVYKFSDELKGYCQQGHNMVVELERFQAAQAQRNSRQKASVPEK